MRGELTEWAGAAKSGDRDAFSQLYAQIYRDLYRFAFYTLGNAADAEDAVGEAVCEALAAISGLQEPAAFKTWMFTILSRVCKRSVKRIIRARNELAFDDLGEFGDGADMQEALDIRSQIHVLPDSDRIVVLLSVVGGYTSYEISNMLKKPAGTVRSKLSRALSKLRTAYEET